MKTIISILGLAFILGVLWFIFWVPFFGFHYETARGEHTGYISATEKSGIFFKTGTAYLKTDTQSSQEDAYCVIDDQILNRLKEASVSKEHVNVKYYSLFSAGISNCDGEGAIIYDVTTVQD